MVRDGLGWRIRFKQGFGGQHMGLRQIADVGEIKQVLAVSDLELVFARLSGFTMLATVTRSPSPKIPAGRSAAVIILPFLRLAARTISSATPFVCE